MCFGFCCGMNTPVIINPTSRSKCLSKALFVLLWCEVVVAVLYFTSVVFIFSGVIELLLVLLLYLAYSSYIFGHLVIYLFMQMFNLLRTFCYIGGLVQHSLMFKKIKIQYVGESIEFAIYSEIVSLLAFVFYIIAIIFVFLAYREFKANIMDEQRGVRYSELPQRRDSPKEARPKFPGRSQVIGS